MEPQQNQQVNQANCVGNSIAKKCSLYLFVLGSTPGAFCFLHLYGACVAVQTEARSTSLE